MLSTRINSWPGRGVGLVHFTTAPKEVNHHKRLFVHYPLRIAFEAEDMYVYRAQSGPSKMRDWVEEYL